MRREKPRAAPSACLRCRAASPSRSRSSFRSDDPSRITNRVVGALLLIGSDERSLPIARDPRPSPLTAHQRLQRAGQRPSTPPGAPTEAFDSLIVIGASAGGMGALTTIFESIPADLPAAIVLVLHQRSDSPYKMAK